MAKIIWREPNRKINTRGEVSVPDVRPIAKAEKDDKFEVKSDGAWYAADLKFIDGMITVDFNEYDEDEVWSVETVRSAKPLRDLIRVESPQLQDAECRLASVNKPVCAFRKSGKQEGWHDATVTEVTRRPHSFEDGCETCTCSFTVIWRGGPAKGRCGRDLKCGDICLFSIKDVETHPFIVDILRHVSDDGDAQDQVEKIPRSSASKAKRTASDADNGQAPLDELKNVRSFKRLKSKATTVSSVKTTVLDEHSGSACKPDKQSASTAVDTGLQGQPLRAKLSQEQNETTKSMGLSTDTNFKEQLPGENFVSATTDPCKNHHMTRTPCAASGNVDLLRQSHDISLPFQGSEHIPGNITCDFVDVKEVRQLFGTKFEPTVKGNLKQERTETVALCVEAQPSKKVRITVGFDIELKSSASTHQDLGDSVDKIWAEPKVEYACSYEEFLDSVDRKCTKPKAHTYASKYEELACPAGKPWAEHKVKSVCTYDEFLCSVDRKCTETKVNEYASEYKELVDSVGKPWANPQVKAFVSKRRELLDSGDKSCSEPRIKACVTSTLDEVVGSAGEKADARALDACEDLVCPAGKPSVSKQERSRGCSEKSSVKTAGPKVEARDTCEGLLGQLGNKAEAFASEAFEELSCSIAKRGRGSASPREETLGFPQEKSCAVPEVNASARQPVKGRPKRGLDSHNSCPVNEELMVSKSCAGLDSSGKDVICLSDEEDERVGAGTLPSTSSKGFANPRPGFDSILDGKDGRNAHPGSLPRNRNTLVKHLLAKSGCVLMIDNLEVDVQPLDVLELLLRFCKREKIHSVHIPPPYPDMNHAVGYVVFMDKENADTAAAFMTRYFVVSSHGRPWIVKVQGQDLKEEDFGFPTISAFMEEAQDAIGSSLGGLKIVTSKQELEYNAAKRRLEVFEHHRRQSRIMFLRHAQEEKESDANPDLTLYHKF